jgi:hypothetical protein
MAEQMGSTIALEQSTPAKCVQCPFLDEEDDPFTKSTTFYCKAPWYHPKRWFCTLPTEVVRA